MVPWARFAFRVQTRSFRSAVFSEGKAGIIRCSPPTEARKSTPLVFVHGVCHGAWFWRGYQQQCAQAGYESFAVDLKSLSMGLGSNVGQHAQHVWAALSENGIQSPVILGHSLGSVIAQEMVQPSYSQWADVQGMVLMGGATRRVYSELLRHFVHLLGNAGMRTFLVAHNFAHVTPDAKAMQKLFFLPSTQVTTLPGAGDTLTMEEYYTKLKTRDVALGLLDMIPGSTEFPTVPKLVVVPLQDGAIPIATQRRLASLAAAELMEVDNMGHCLGDEGWESLLCAPLIEWLDRNISPN